MRNLLLTICILLAAPLAYTQGVYKTLDQEIDNWMMNLENELLVSTKPTTIFEHKEYQYTIIGHFKKGIAKEGSYIIINDYSNSIQISGVITYHMGDTYVKGLKKVKDTSYTYGTFLVSNTSTGFIITNKAKQATKLYSATVDVVYMKSICFNNPDTGSINSSWIAQKLFGSKDIEAAITLSATSDGKCAKMSLKYKPEYSIISEDLYVPDSLITANNIRDIKFYYQHTTEISIKYKDGRRYQGKCRISVKEEGEVTPVRTMTMGTYTYSNGDIFVGDMSGRKCAGIPVNGIMKFVDGSYKFGNWINEYQLSKSQVATLDSYENPSTIRKVAEMYEWSNKYTVYKPGEVIEYFSPENEKLSYIDNDEILYDRATQWYLCKKWKNTVLKFKIDSYGRRIKEIVYNYYNHTPEYINHFELYSNGEVKTIRTYHYDSGMLYLVINCYSDGTLKSAYRYGIGNNGRNIVRRSKEWDNDRFYKDFRTVQYDLDGKFERMIDWRIGEYGFTSNMINFTPEIVDIKSFKRSPLDNDYYNSHIAGNRETIFEKDKEISQIHDILFNILNDNRDAVADHIFYPFQRKYPLPWIKNKEEMLQSYDIIFTDELKQKIVENSKIHSIGCRGMAICDYLMCGKTYDDGFKIYDIYMESAEEKALWEKAMVERKANLHPSVQDCIEPIRIYRTKKFTIMIDKVSEKENGYRYACWRAGTDMKDTPSLVLYNGTVDVQGSIRLTSYTFTNNIYKYVVDEAEGLFVYKNEKLILKDDIISIE